MTSVSTKGMKVVVGVIAAALAIGLIAKHGGNSGNGPMNAMGAPGAMGAPSASDNGDLARLQQAHAELMAQVNACNQLSDQATAELQAHILNGEVVYPNPPACTNMMPTWIAQGAWLEKEIDKLQTGVDLPVTSYVPGLPSSSSNYSGAQPSDHVDNYDITAVRNHSLFRDSSGVTYEVDSLSTYAFRNRATGAIVTNDSGNAPTDGDWEQLSPAQ